MSTGIRVPYQEARAVADALVSALSPACLRLEIAGSIRRGADDAGDVELVAIPRSHEETVAEGLFETRTIVVDELLQAADGHGGRDLPARQGGWTPARYRPSRRLMDPYEFRPRHSWRTPPVSQPTR